MAANDAAIPNQPGVADSFCRPAMGANAVGGASRLITWGSSC